MVFIDVEENGNLAVHWQFIMVKPMAPRSSANMASFVPGERRQATPQVAQGWSGGKFIEQMALESTNLLVELCNLSIPYSWLIPYLDSLLDSLLVEFTL